MTNSNDDKKTNDKTNDNDKVNTNTSEKNNGPLRGSGLEQEEKASLAQEGPGGNTTGNGPGVLPGQTIDENNTSPLADSIEAEKLAAYKKNTEDTKE